MPSRSFAWLNATQFLGALNDNLFKLLLVFFLIALEGPGSAGRVAAPGRSGPPVASGTAASPPSNITVPDGAIAIRPAGAYRGDAIAPTPRSRNRSRAMESW